MENKPPVHGLRPLKILLNVKLLKEAAHIPLELFALLSPLPAVSISSVSFPSAHTSSLHSRYHAKADLPLQSEKAVTLSCPFSAAALIYMYYPI